MTMRVRRKGETEAEWFYQGLVDVRLSPQLPWQARLATEVSFDFIVSSAGGGRSCIGVEVRSDSFEALAQAMMDVDPDAATKAFGAALVRGKREVSSDEDGNYEWAA